MKVTEIKFCRGLIFHRINGPALIYPSGTKVWFKHNKRHRNNGPAVIYFSGNKYWFKNGKFIK